jgi:glycosyltransferase involved in cell wall biosynthesis
MSNLVSIIVPVHNSSKFLNSLLSSLSNQTYPLFEVLLIDDCSTDGSYQICQSKANTDQRFHVFHNTFLAGVSAARNLGISEANGNYITFVDADDYIDKDYLSIMMREIITHNCSIVSCNSTSKENNLGKRTEFTSKEESVYHLSKSVHKNDSDNHIWGRIYRRDVINGHRFDVSFKMAEDTVFLATLCDGKKLSIRYLNYIGYYHRLNPSGLVLSYNVDKYYTSLVHLYDYYSYPTRDDEDRKLVLNRLITIIKGLLKECKLNDEMITKVLTIGKAIRRKALVTRNVSLKNKIFLLFGLRKPFTTIDLSKPSKFF